MDPTDDEIEQASERGRRRRLTNATVLSARYDQGRGRVVLRTDNGLEVMFAPRDAEGLGNASADQLSKIELSAGGLGLHFPLLDADFDVPALLEGRLGSDRWTHSRRHDRPAA